MDRTNAVAPDNANDLAKNLASDLASMRALAEAGRDAPLIGGAFYMLWGGLMSAAALCVFLAEKGVIAIAGGGVYNVWIVAGVLGWAGSMLLGRRIGARPGALTLGNRTARAVWFSVGVFVTIIWIALMFAHDNFTALGVPRYFLFSMMFPIAFGLYGVAFYATAVAARQTWLKGFAALSWAFSVASVFFLDSADLFAIGAAGTFSCAFVPGLLLSLNERKAS